MRACGLARAPPRCSASSARRAASRGLAHARRRPRLERVPVAVDRQSTSSRTAGVRPAVSTKREVVDPCRGFHAAVGLLPRDGSGARPSTARPSGSGERRDVARAAGGRATARAGADVRGVDGEPLARARSRGSAVRAPRARSIAGQGRSGFTWSGVSGDTPPQSSMPASSSRGAASGSDEVRRRLHAHLRARARARGDRDRGAGTRRRPASGAARIAVSGLGPEVLDDDLLDVPVPPVRARGSRTATRRARERSRRCRRGCRW